MSNSEQVLDLDLESYQFAGASRNILSDIEIKLKSAERVAIMGASASGKTTLLKICAGLSGNGIFSGRCIKAGQVAMVFQDNVLLDYLSVRGNILLPSKIKGGYVDIGEISRSLHIDHLLDAFPLRLSGGERKRVALARSLAYPQLSALIMDEPFAALDLSLKESILVDLKERLDKAKHACLFATHSPEEAVFLADRIVFLGGSPASITRTLSVDLPKGRGAEAFQTEVFQSLVLKVASLMRSMNLPSSL